MKEDYEKMKGGWTHLPQGPGNRRLAFCDLDELFTKTGKPKVKRPIRFQQHGRPALAQDFDSGDSDACGGARPAGVLEASLPAKQAHALVQRGFVETAALEATPSRHDRTPVCFQKVTAFAVTPKTSQGGSIPNPGE